MRQTLGWSLVKRASNVPHAQFGVFIRGHVPSAGLVTALYPGTIYQSGESMLLQSISPTRHFSFRNKFILQRKDNVRIDGNDRCLSAWIFRSCARRDFALFNALYSIADDSWIHYFEHYDNRSLRQSVSMGPEERMEAPNSKFQFLNPLALGHYVNSSSDSTAPPNVMYLELDCELGVDVPLSLAHFVPAVNFTAAHLSSSSSSSSSSSPASNSINPVLLRTACLASLRPIEDGEELLAAYFTEVSSAKS